MITLIDAETGERPLDGDLDGGGLVAEPAALEAVTGWALKPEGLCRDDVCIPVRDRDSLLADQRIDLEAFGAALHRLAVVDVDERVMALGAPASERASLLETGHAPDFELPDLDGGRFRLSSIG